MWINIRRKWERDFYPNLRSKFCFVCCCCCKGRKEGRAVGEWRRRHGYYGYGFGVVGGTDAESEMDRQRVHRQSLRRRHRGRTQAPNLRANQRLTPSAKALVPQTRFQTQRRLSLPLPAPPQLLSQDDHDRVRHYALSRFVSHFYF